jgi:type I restriction enzyme S subunit
VGSSKKTVEVGTVLVCKINPRINRVWVVRGDSGHERIASTEWIPFFPRQDVEPDYLKYYLQRSKFRDYLASNVSGVGGSLMRVRPAIVDRYPFPMRPRREQKAVVASVDSLFTRLDAAVAALRRVQANVKRCRASVLNAACDGRLVPTEAAQARAEGRDYEPARVLLERILEERRRKWEEAERAKMMAKGKVPADERWKTKYNEPAGPDVGRLPGLPEGWCWATVGQLGHVGTGATPRRSNPAYYEGATIPWIKSAALNEEYVRRAEESVTAKAVTETNLTLYPRHTLLVAMYGEGQTRGRCSELLIEATTNQAIAAIVTLGEGADVRPYLKLFLLKNYEDVRRLSVGGVQPNLILGMIAAIPVPLPPIAEQKRIVAAVDKRLSVGAAAGRVIEFSLGRSATLRQSVLQSAFEGRLFVRGQQLAVGG